jgi:hypothetical protein
MLRRILGPIAGVIAAIVIVSAWEMLVHYVRPLPLTREGPGDAITLLLVVLGYGAGAYIGGLIAMRVARAGAAWPAWIPAGVIALAALANVAMIPHPIWFIVLALAAAAAGGWVAGGGRISRA